jgi:competence protein ComFC
MKKILEFFIRLVYPEICHQCQKTLDIDDRTLCPECYQQFKSEIYDFLDCEIPHKADPLRHLWSLAAYQNTTKNILQSFKFEKQFHLINLFNPLIKDFYSAIKPEIHHDMIIFVPSSLFHKIDRFYCCAEEFEKILCSHFKIASGNLFIRKKLGVPSQSTLKQEERLANLYGAFKISHSDQIRGRSILVVDDIYTTGTTVQEIARILMNAGAKSVDCFAFAHTIEINPREEA